MRLWCSCIAYFSSKEMGTVGICIDVLLIISIYIYISCLIYVIYTKQQVSKIMEFAEEIDQLKQLFDDSQHIIDTMFSGLMDSKSTTDSRAYANRQSAAMLCNQMALDIYNASKYLKSLYKMLQRGFDNESYDRDASKLESRIKRLERLLK